jgi:HNH endonuclease
MTYTENIRAARMEANGGSHTREEWEDRKRRQHYRCWNEYCKCDLNAPGVLTHKDHFIPVARGGTDNIKNIVALCGPCNMRKGKKTWDEFMEREILRQQFHGMGEHASDIGRQEYSGQGNAHFGAGGGGNFTGATPQGANGGGGVRSILQFLIGIPKGAFVLICGALFVVLLLLALIGDGKKRNGGGRLAEGAVGAFGLWRLSTWAFRDNSVAKGMGMAVGALAAGLWLLSLSGGHGAARPATAATDPGRYHVTETVPASAHVDAPPDVRPVPLDDGPVAIRPLPTKPFRPPVWTPHNNPSAPPAVASTPHGRMGLTVASPFPSYAGGPVAPRRNIGCGWWPVGSDADRDCAARLGHRPGTVTAEGWKR